MADQSIRAAELLDALPEPEEEDTTPQPPMSAIYTISEDPEEAELEAKELSKYFLAKSFFDCHEYDRCAAVFLPDSLLSSVLNSKSEPTPLTPKGKGKAPATSNVPSLPNISQKSLFLALYGKFMAGEKRKHEESEMVMGPQDLGTVVNKELLVIGRYLSAWFDQRTDDDENAIKSQGWLEYL